MQIWRIVANHGLHHIGDHHSSQSGRCSSIIYNLIRMFTHPKLAQGFFACSIAALAMLSGCGSSTDNSPNPAIQFPNIDLVTSSTTIASASPNQNPGTGFRLRFRATKGSVDLKSIQITASGGASLSAGYGSGGVKQIPTLRLADFSDSTTIQLSSAPTAPKVKIVVTDINNLRDSLIITPVGTRAYTTKLLYTPLATGAAKCFLNTATGVTYTPGQANGTVSAGIDFGFYYGATNNATLCSPHVFELNLNPPGTTIVNLTSWTVKNNTKLKTTSTSYTGNHTVDEIRSLYDSGTDASNSTDNPLSRAVTLSTTSNFTFLTAAGKYGIGKVTNITPSTGSTGSITINYQIQY
jgi:hypothetical protein